MFKFSNTKLFRYGTKHDEKTNVLMFNINCNLFEINGKFISYFHFMASFNIKKPLLI